METIAMQMSRDKVSGYLFFRSVIRLQLLTVGLWPSENPNLFYRLRPFPFLFVSLFVILGIILHIRAHITNIGTVTRALNTLTSCFATILRMLCVMVNRNDAHELHNILDRHFNEMIDGKYFTAKLKDFGIIHRIWGIYFFCVGFSLLLIAAAPSISIIHQYRHSVNPIFYPLVFPTTYPWSLNSPGPRYKLHLIFELVTVVSQFCITSIDSLFMMYGFQMGAQFREMSHRMMNIDKTNDVRKILPECVAQHQAMMRCRDILQVIFGPILLWIMTTNAVALCSMMYQLSQMKSISISTILIFGAYFTAKTLQAFMYAYTGTFLTSESENYQQAIYIADWQTDKRFMQSVLIMLIQKPIILTACNFSLVSLDLFVKVMNTTVSYFFLLQAVL